MNKESIDISFKKFKEKRQYKNLKKTVREKFTY